MSNGSNTAPPFILMSLQNFLLQPFSLALTLTSVGPWCSPCPHALLVYPPLLLPTFPSTNSLPWLTLELAGRQALSPSTDASFPVFMLKVLLILDTWPRKPCSPATKLNGEDRVF